MSSRLSLTVAQLEEMDYMPRRKYASGEELRAYANSICTKYRLHERGMFQSSVRSLEWSSGKSEWIVQIEQIPKVNMDLPQGNGRASLT